MLSGEYASVRVDDITWSRSERIRKIITDDAVIEKMDSIRRVGLIHPLVITREFVGVSGETRWTALKRLGHSHVQIQWSDTVEPDVLLSIELEENIKRTDLPWQDQCDALLRYHNLQLTHDPAWTLEKTGDAIGLDKSTVSKQLGVARALAAGDTRVTAAKEYSVAAGIVQRKTERAKADELSLLGVDPDAVSVVLLSTSPIQTTSFLEWVETYSGPPFNVIHCDFPYGIGADKFNQGAGDAYGGYEDTPETYWALLEGLVRNKEKLLGSSGHIIFWFSMRYYTETLLKLSEHFWVDPYPLVWHKSDNKGTLPDPQRGPRRIYEVAFLCSHGDRKIISSVSNVCSAPTTRVSEHMSEKSQPMLEHFLRMVVDSNTRFLDPTCGGGSALRAARSLGASSILGLEINPEFADNARRAFDAQS